MLLRWLQQQELIDEHMTWWLMKIVLKIGPILRLEGSMYTLLRFLWHKQCHGVHFSTFWTFKKVLIDVMFVSIHTNFVLLQNCNLTFVLCLHALTMSIALILF
jgi:hypothetical protein